MDFFEYFNSINSALEHFDVGKKFMWLYLVIAAAMFVVLYAFKAIALFTIARREGYKNPWLAFIPIASTYYVGVVSEKNKIFNMNPKNVALAVAIAEAVSVVLYILDVSALFAIFSGGFAEPSFEVISYGGATQEVLVGYTLKTLPDNLAWAGAVYNYFYIPKVILNIILLVGEIFLLISFFQTYSCRYYIAFALLSMFFPIEGILMFAVRNNRAKNYMQYVRERQQRQYRQYEDYMRSQGGAPYNNGGSYYGTPPQDPFSDVSSSNQGNSSGQNGDSQSNPPKSDNDPFSDF